MPEILFHSLFAVLAALLVGGLWVLVCNQFTYLHRVHIINDIFDKYQGKDTQLYRNYVKLSYDQHLWRLATFRWNWKAWYYEAK